MTTYRNKVRKNNLTNTVTVYHGSKEKFDTFNFSKIGLNGTSEGKGIYFTDNKGIASGYGEDGYLYTVKLHMNKSLKLNEKYITKQELKALFLHLYNQDEYHLSNWGDASYDGLEKVLNFAVENTFYNDCDVDMIAGIVNAIGCVETVNNAVYEVLGYDSIIAIPKWQTDNQTLYIALVNDIIEIESINYTSKEGKEMTTIVYETTFTFNELEFFTDLLNKEKGMTEVEKENTLSGMNLENVDFKFTYQKDSNGSWFKKCYKGKQPIAWENVENWMRAHVWNFEKENKVYFS